MLQSQSWMDLNRINNYDNDNKNDREKQLLNENQRKIFLWIDDGEWDLAESYLKAGELSVDEKKELISFVDEWKRNLLMYALQYDAPLSFIRLITSLVEEKALVQRDKLGRNVFHYTCQYHSSLQVLNHIYKTLAKKCDNVENIILSSSNYEWNGFHSICWNKKVSKKLIRSLLDIVKKYDHENKFTLSSDDSGCNGFHFICKNENVSTETIIYVVDAMTKNETGKNLILSTTNDGWNGLHCICWNQSATTESICLVVEIMMKYDTQKTFILDHAIEQIDTRNFYLESPKRANDTMKLVLSLFNDVCTQEDILKMNPDNCHYLLQLPNKDRSWLNHLMIKKVLNARFISGAAIAILMLDLYAQISLVILFQFHIERATEKQNISLVLSFTVPALTWFIFRELTQLANNNPIHFATDPFNFVDVIQIIVVSLVLKNIINDTLYSAGQSVLLIATFTVWIELLFTIGHLIFPIAVFNVALVEVILKLVPFLLTTIIVVLAFANAFYLAGPRIFDDRDNDLCTLDNGVKFTQDEYNDGGWTCTRYDSITATMDMVLSGEWFFLGSYPQTRQSVLSSFYSFIIGIILLNIIIGVISDAFMKNHSEIASWTNRHKFLTNDVDGMENFFEYLQKFCHCFLVKKRGSNSKDATTHSRPNFYTGLVNILIEPTHYLQEMKEKTKIKNENNFLYKIRYFSLLPLIAILTVLHFAAGALSSGILWRKFMREMLFFGPITKNENETSFSSDKVSNNQLHTKIKRLNTQNDELNCKVDEMIGIIDLLVDEMKKQNK